MLTYDDFKKYPKATDYYDVCDFYYVEPDIEGIITLASLGDIFILEPTGPYSQPWHDNLLKRGKEVRLVAHNKLRSFALHKGFKSKDDEPDAVALAYYGWEYLDVPSQFNRLRDPRLQQIYEMILGKQRNLKDCTRNKNRARALLRKECPELRKRKGSNIARATLWPFIAGNLDVLSQRTIS